MKFYKKEVLKKRLYVIVIITAIITLLGQSCIRLYLNDTEFSGVVSKVFAESEDESAQTGSVEKQKESREKTPVYGDKVADGEYEIDVDSSSSMFRITKAVLTVESGRMSAIITLSGKGYGKLFMGSSNEAEEADEEEFIPYEEDAQGAYTYRIPVEFLNKEIACAAWSIKKEKWYDRDLVFKVDSLPEGAVDTTAVTSDTDGDSGGLLHQSSENGNMAVKTVRTKAADGKYMLKIELSGGSGKTSIASPAEVTVKEGAVWAKIEWSSPNYDYMIVDGNRYNALSSDGNSNFEIPVLKLDEEFIVIADTTAMGTPHEIEYALKFDSSGLKADDKQDIKSMKLAFIVIIIFIIIAFVTGFFAGRKIAAKRRQRK